MKDLIKVNSFLSGCKTVSELVKKMEKSENYIAQGDIKTTHLFSGGMYARTFYPKAGSLIVGKIHKFAGFNVLLKGSVSIYDGSDVRTFQAPCTWEAPAFTQKVGYFHEDSEFMSVITCFANNVEDAEKELYFPDDVTIEQVNDWLSYNDMLNKLNMSEEEVQKFVNLDNLIENKLSDFELKKSKIHGIGFFTTKEYKKDECIGDALIDGKRTELGRWVNNSAIPNACAVFSDDNNAKVFAKRDINKGEEITLLYIENFKGGKL